MAMTAFACPACNKVLKSSNPLPAGKKVKCPGCGNIFTVPGEEEAAIQARSPVPLPRAGRKTRRDEDSGDDPPRQRKSRRDEDDERPRNKQRRREEDEDDDLPQRKRRACDDDEEDEDDDKPRSRKSRRKPAKSRTLLFVGLGGGLLALLLIVVGVVLFGFVLGTAAAANDPLVFLPADGNLVFGANFAHLRNNPDFKKGVDQALAMNPNVMPGLRDFMQECDSFMIAGNSARQDFAGTAVFLTAKPQDPEKVRQAFAAGPAEKMQGATIFRSKDGIVLMPNPKMIVLTKLPDAQLAKLLESKSPALKADLLSQVSTLRRNTVWLAVSLDGEPRKELQKIKAKDLQSNPFIGKELAAFVPALQQAKFATAVMDLGPDAKSLKLEVGLQCANEADAKKGEAALKGFWDTSGKGFLNMAQMMMPAKGPEVAGVQTLISEVTNNLKIQSAGANLTVSLALSENALK